MTSESKGAAVSATARTAAGTSGARPVMLVTGAGHGIGAATVLLAAQRGYDVCLTYRQSREAAESVLAEARALGARAIAVQSDAADKRQVAHLFTQIDAELGTLTALVNNAGSVGRMATLGELEIGDLDAAFAANVRSCFLNTRQAIARMAVDQGGRGGSIVNVSSRAARLGGANEWVHYAACKGAVDSLTLGSARELAPRGIRVNAVAPGLIDTNLHARAGVPDRLSRLAGSIPIARAGNALEVARAILWLLSDEASYVTGAILPVSGGR